MSQGGEASQLTSHHAVLVLLTNSASQDELDELDEQEDEDEMDELEKELEQELLEQELSEDEELDEEQELELEDDGRTTSSSTSVTRSHQVGSSKSSLNSRSASCAAVFEMYQVCTQFVIVSVG